MHEGKGQGRAPAPQKTPPGDPACEETADRADSGAVKKSPNRVVEFVIADPNEIDVVRETNCERMPRGRRRNFEKRNQRLEDPIPQHHNMHLKRWNLSVLAQLTCRPQPTDFP